MLPGPPRRDANAGGPGGNRLSEPLPVPQRAQPRSKLLRRLHLIRRHRHREEVSRNAGRRFTGGAHVRLLCSATRGCVADAGCVPPKPVRGGWRLLAELDPDQAGNSLNRDQVPTAQGGAQWYAATVRHVLLRTS